MNKLSKLVFASILSCSTFFVYSEQPIKPVVTDKSDVISIIYLNKANEQSLISLIGIGRNKAAAIIEYRKANGNFTAVDQLLNVKGIGKNILNKNIHRLKI